MNNYDSLKDFDILTEIYIEKDYMKLCLGDKNISESEIKRIEKHYKERKDLEWKILTRLKEKYSIKEIDAMLKKKLVNHRCNFEFMTSRRAVLPEKEATNVFSLYTYKKMLNECEENYKTKELKKELDDVKCMCHPVHLETDNECPEIKHLHVLRDGKKMCLHDYIITLDKKKEQKGGSYTFADIGKKHDTNVLSYQPGTSNVDKTTADNGNLMPLKTFYEDLAEIAIRTKQVVAYQKSTNTDDIYKILSEKLKAMDPIKFGMTMNASKLKRIILCGRYIASYYEFLFKEFIQDYGNYVPTDIPVISEKNDPGKYYGSMLIKNFCVFPQNNTDTSFSSGGANIKIYDINSLNGSICALYKPDSVVATEFNKFLSTEHSMNKNIGYRTCEVVYRELCENFELVEKMKTPASTDKYRLELSSLNFEPDFGNTLSMNSGITSPSIYNMHSYGTATVVFPKYSPPALDTTLTDTSSPWHPITNPHKTTLLDQEKYVEQYFYNCAQFNALQNAYNNKIGTQVVGSLQATETNDTINPNAPYIVRRLHADKGDTNNYESVAGFTNIATNRNPVTENLPSTFHSVFAPTGTTYSTPTSFVCPPASKYHFKIKHATYNKRITGNDSTSFDIYGNYITLNQAESKNLFPRPIIDETGRWVSGFVSRANREYLDTTVPTNVTDLKTKRVHVQRYIKELLFDIHAICELYLDTFDVLSLTTETMRPLIRDLYEPLSSNASINIARIIRYEDKYTKNIDIPNKAHSVLSEALGIQGEIKKIRHDQVTSIKNKYNYITANIDTTDATRKGLVVKTMKEYGPFFLLGNKEEKNGFDPTSKQNNIKLSTLSEYEPHTEQLALKNDLSKLSAMIKTVNPLFAKNQQPLENTETMHNIEMNNIITDRTNRFRAEKDSRNNYGKRIIADDKYIRENKYGGSSNKILKTINGIVKTIRDETNAIGSNINNMFSTKLLPINKEMLISLLDTYLHDEYATGLLKHPINANAKTFLKRLLPATGGSAQANTSLRSAITEFQKDAAMNVNAYKGYIKDFLEKLYAQLYEELKKLIKAIVDIRGPTPKHKTDRQKAVNELRQSYLWDLFKVPYKYLFAGIFHNKTIQGIDTQLNIADKAPFDAITNNTASPDEIAASNAVAVELVKNIASDSQNYHSKIISLKDEYDKELLPFVRYIDFINNSYYNFSHSGKDEYVKDFAEYNKISLGTVTYYNKIINKLDKAMKDGSNNDPIIEYFRQYHLIAVEVTKDLLNYLANYKVLVFSNDANIAPHAKGYPNPSYKAGNAQGIEDYEKLTKNISNVLIDMKKARAVPDENYTRTYLTFSYFRTLLDRWNGVSSDPFVANLRINDFTENPGKNEKILDINKNDFNDTNITVTNFRKKKQVGLIEPRSMKLPYSLYENFKDTLPFTSVEGAKLKISSDKIYSHMLNYNKKVSTPPNDVDYTLYTTLDGGAYITSMAPTGTVIGSRTPLTITTGISEKTTENPKKKHDDSTDKINSIDNIKKIIIDNFDGKLEIPFANVFDSQSFPDSNDISKYMNIVQQLIDGIGILMLTYGYSGTGKTYSIFGGDDVDGVVSSVMKELLTQKGTLFRVYELYGLGTAYSSYWQMIQEWYKDIEAGGNGTDINKYLQPNQILIKYKLSDNGSGEFSIDKPIIVNSTDKISKFVTEMTDPKEQTNPTDDEFNGYKIINDIDAVTKNLKKFVSKIDDYREKGTDVKNAFRHIIKRVAETVNNPSSSRGYVVYEFQIFDNGKYTPFIIIDLPGKEEIIPSYVESSHFFDGYTPTTPDEITTMLKLTVHPLLIPSIPGANKYIFDMLINVYNIDKDVAKYILKQFMGTEITLPFKGSTNDVPIWHLFKSNDTININKTLDDVVDFISDVIEKRPTQIANNFNLFLKKGTYNNHTFFESKSLFDTCNIKNTAADDLMCDKALQILFPTLINVLIRNNYFGILVDMSARILHGLVQPSTTQNIEETIRKMYNVYEGYYINENINGLLDSVLKKKNPLHRAATSATSVSNATDMKNVYEYIKGSVIYEQINNKNAPAGIALELPFKNNNMDKYLLIGKGFTVTNSAPTKFNEITFLSKDNHDSFKVIKENNDKIVTNMLKTGYKSNQVFCTHRALIQDVADVILIAVKNVNLFCVVSNNDPETKSFPQLKLLADTSNFIKRLQS